MVEYRWRYGPRYRVVAEVDPVSRTKQSFKDECDINVIMRRYEKNGVLPMMNQREPRFVDATSEDFQQAMFLIADAKAMFSQLPARLRERFENDPGKLLAFLDDPKNLPEARELGIVMPEPVPPEPVEVRVVTPQAKPGEGV